MITAQIGEAFAFGSDRIAIRLTARDPDALQASQHASVELNEFTGAILKYEAPDLTSGGGRPTLSLTEPEGRALLEVLAAHFGGTGPAKAARDDFLHERGRVDTLIDALVGFAGDAIGALGDTAVAALEPPPAPQTVLAEPNHHRALIS